MLNYGYGWLCTWQQMANVQGGICLIAYTYAYPCVCDVWAISRLVAVVVNWLSCKHLTYVYLGRSYYRGGAEVDNARTLI